jgi:hypothetical protein
VRQKALNFWNERIQLVKFTAVGNKKNELLMVMTLGDGVSVERLFDAGLAQSKLYITMLNIGTAGFFWYDLSGQTQHFYESIRDLDTPNFEPRVGRIESLQSEWEENRPGAARRQRVALEDSHLNNTIMCLAAFAPMSNGDTAPILGPYLQGLTLLSKTDIHLSLEQQANDAFLAALRNAMRHFADWDGDETGLLGALHRAVTPVIASEADRNQLFSSLEAQTTNSQGRLSSAVNSKRIVDLYLVIVAHRLWPEFIKRADTIRANNSE